MNSLFFFCPSYYYPIHFHTFRSFACLKSTLLLLMIGMLYLEDYYLVMRSKLLFRRNRQTICNLIIIIFLFGMWHLSPKNWFKNLQTIMHFCHIIFIECRFFWMNNNYLRVRLNLLTYDYDFFFPSVFSWRICSFLCFGSSLTLCGSIVCHFQ